MENNRYINTSNFLFMIRKSLLLFLALGISCFTTFVQEADILIKNGVLIDSKNGINEKMDMAVKDGKVYRKPGYCLFWTWGLLPKVLSKYFYGCPFR